MSGLASPSELILDEEDFLKIPGSLYSREALLYAGFTDHAADEIWQRWVRWPAGDDGREIDGGPVTLASMATGHVRSTSQNAFDSDDSKWFEALNAYGIAETTQEAIMAPAYKSIRLTASCQYWVLDTIKARFDGLRAIRATSPERASQAATREASEISSSGRAPASIAPAHPGILPEPASNPIVRENAPGTTTLWKGTYQTRIDPCFGADNTIKEFGPMITSAAGDFNSKNAASYFALDFEVAEQHACYAKRRSPGEAVVILKLQVPNSALDSLISPQKLHVSYPSEAFQKLVWTCRGMHRMPQELRVFSQATLIIGPICQRPIEVVLNMGSYHEIEESTLLRTSSGNIAMQYAFIGEHGADFLEDSRAVGTFHRISRHHAGEVEKALASTHA